MRDARFILIQRWRRSCDRMVTALRREARALWDGLRDPALGGLALLCILLVFLAFQSGRPFALDVGRRPEEAFLQGFHAAEESGGRTYRWSTDEGVLSIPGLGRSSYRLDLVLAAPHTPGHPPPGLRLEAAGQLLLETVVSPDPGVYSVLLAGQHVPRGDVDLRLRADTFSPSGDARALGVLLDRVELRPIGRPVGVSVQVVLWVLLSVVLVVLLARRLGWSRWAGLGAGSLFALILTAILAWGRFLLTPGLPFLPLGLAVGWAAVALFQGAVRDLFLRSGADLGPRAGRALWSLVAASLAVRLAGVLHPALETWDLCFHWNHLELVTQGKVLFTIVSGEWGSQETFYLPSLYVLMAPLWAIFGGRLVLLKVCGVLLDTSSALLVAYVARRLLGRGWGVPLAAFLYLTMPQSYIIFSWGIAANMLGQWLLLAVLAFVVSPAGLLSGRRAWVAAVGLLSLALLAHPGTVLLTAVLLGGILAASWLSPLPRTFPRPAVWRWGAAGLVVVGLVASLYYSYFAGTMWSSLQRMGEDGSAEPTAESGIVVRGPVVDADLGLVAVRAETQREAVVAGVEELAAEARAYFHTWPLVLALGALIGFVLERRPLAVRLAGLPFVIALAFAAVGLLTNLYVRYMYFLLPTVALGTAWWLAHLTRKRWAGRVVVLAAVVFLGVLGLRFWVEHVLYYSAGCR